MYDDLKALEEKLTQLVSVCKQVRTENLQLRQELAQTQDDCKQLKENMTLASERLAKLVKHLPKEEAGKEPI